MTIKNLSCEIDGNLLFKADRLTIEEGEVIGLIGRNGAGKTFLLKILSGERNDFSGIIQRTGSIYYSDLNMIDTKIKSGGEANISNILHSLRQSASVYLLDEPTTYLDEYNFDKLVRLIERSQSSFCIASHDRTFLDKIATKIWVIEQENIREYNCSFSDYSNERNFQLIQYENELKQYQKKKKENYSDNPIYERREE